MLRKIIFRLCYEMGTAGLLRIQKKGKITVLCFHQVSDTVNPAYPSLGVDTFGRILRYLHTRYAVVHPSEAHIATRKPKVVLTFDDGYKDFNEFAAPMLQQLGMPSVLHLVTDVVQNQQPFWTQTIGAIVNAAVKDNQPLQLTLNGKEHIFHITNANAEQTALDLFELLKMLPFYEKTECLEKLAAQVDTLEYPQMLNEQDIKECIKRGVEIGSHCRTHDYLPSLSHDKQMHELSVSRNYLQQLTGQSVDCFAAPNGHVTPEIFAAAKEAGYKYIFSTLPEFNSPQNWESRPISRILVYRNDPYENIFRLEGFHRKLVS